LDFFEINSWELFAQGLLLLTSVSQVARIMGMSHQHLAPIDLWPGSKNNKME
jgi:hypothetical protein